VLTIDDLIQRLIDAKNDRKNKLRGNAVVHLCVPEIEYLPIIDTKMEPSQDGAVMLLMVQDGKLSPTVVPNVIIDMSGGFVQGVSSDFPVKYLLLDHDSILDECNPEWCEAREDYKRVSVLLDDPAAEENEGVELLVEIDGDNAKRADYLAQLLKILNVEPVSVDKNGETDDVNYDFEDFEAAMQAKELVDAAGLPFVRYTSVAN
jgi:hypothetical protein